VPTQTLDAIAARNSMTRLQSVTLALTGRTLHLWKIDDNTPVPEKMTTVSSSEPQVAGAQPNYLYRVAQAGTVPINADQYAPQKLGLPDAHRLAKGDRILIAVIDSQVDASHPDLAGAIAGSYAASEDAERAHPHGTGMAGAIAARRTMLGIAPGVGLLTVRAFSAQGGSAEGTTFNILKGIDWAATQGARIINMSFAGPPDPRLRDELNRAYRKGIVLIAAAGNAGPNSPPLYPAADPNVIAVTATSADDKLFAGANRGNYIAVAAPGVDIFAPAPDGAYQFTTGTSVAAAGERRRCAADRAQSVADAGRGPQDPDGHRQGPRTKGSRPRFRRRSRQCVAGTDRDPAEVACLVGRISLFAKSGSAAARLAGVQVTVRCPGCKRAQSGLRQQSSER
jgi:subtilisin family serine protease